MTALCAVAQDGTFVIPLTGFREVPKTLSVDSSGIAKLRVKGSAIHYQLTYGVLGTTVTAAHITWARTRQWVGLPLSCAGAARSQLARRQAGP